VAQVGRLAPNYTYLRLVYHRQSKYLLPIQYKLAALSQTNFNVL